MKQIKDMLIKESTEAMERDEKIIKLIEDLQKNIAEKSISGSSLSHEHPKATSAAAPLKLLTTHI